MSDDEDKSSQKMEQKEDVMEELVVPVRLKFPFNSFIGKQLLSLSEDQRSILVSSLCSALSLTLTVASSHLKEGIPLWADELRAKIKDVEEGVKQVKEQSVLPKWGSDLTQQVAQLSGDVSKQFKQVSTQVQEVKEQNIAMNASSHHKGKQKEGKIIKVMEEILAEYSLSNEFVKYEVKDTSYDHKYADVLVTVIHYKDLKHEKIESQIQFMIESKTGKTSIARKEVEKLEQKLTNCNEVDAAILFAQGDIAGTKHSKIVSRFISSPKKPVIMISNQEDFELLYLITKMLLDWMPKCIPKCVVSKDVSFKTDEKEGEKEKEQERQERNRLERQIKYQIDVLNEQMRLLEDLAKQEKNLEKHLGLMKASLNKLRERTFRARADMISFSPTFKDEPEDKEQEDYNIVQPLLLSNLSKGLGSPSEIPINRKRKASAMNGSLDSFPVTKSKQDKLNDST